MKLRAVALLVVFSACSSQLADLPASPDTVRERLETPTQLLVATDVSGGALTAAHKVGTGWEAGLVELGIENGELILSSDARDAVTIDGLQLSFKPLQIPAGVFGDSDAKLTNVRIDLTAEHRTPAVWTGDNEVSLSAMLEITLSWTLSLNGSPAPLGSPTLPRLPVEIVLTGNGAQVDADLRAYSSGELWSWAGLVKLSELQLVLGANLAPSEM